MSPKVKEIKTVEWINSTHFYAVILSTEGDFIPYAYNPRDGWWRWAYRDQPSASISISEVPPEVLARFSKDVN